MSRLRAQTRLVIATSATLALAASLLTLGSATRSDASWTDNEYATGPVGVVNCAASDGDFASRGDGTLLSGQLLGTDLNTVAEVAGMQVTNNGVRPLPNPADATQAKDADGAPDQNAFINPLNLAALNGVQLTGASGLVSLGSLLALPLDNSTGVVTQYARAGADGTSAGAAGYATNSGAIETSNAGGGYPDLGSIDLTNLVGAVNPAAAASLSSITDAALTIGAVTGRATLNGCDAAFAGIASAVTRDYLVAGLGATINSDTVKSLNVSSAIDDIGEAIDGLNPTAESAINTGVNTLVNGLVGSSSLLKVGNANTTLTVTSVNLADVYAVLTTPVQDPNGIVTISPNTGDVTINLAALFGAPYNATSGLNGLDPNTALDFDSTLIIPRLTAAAGSALNSFTGHLQSAITGALNSMKLSADVELSLTLCPLGICALNPIGLIKATVAGSLNDLVSGAAIADVTLPALGALGSVVTDLLTVLTSGLKAQLGEVVGNAVDTTLASTVAAATAAGAVSTLLSDVITTLFVNGVVTLDVNIQNVPLAGNAAPVDWDGIPAGQYDVAALRVGVLDALGTSNVALYLGRASVGVTCSVSDARCVGY